MNPKSVIARLRSRFDDIAKRLFRPENEDRRRRPLSDWTAISDRAVPFVLLDRTVDELLRGGFDAVVSTPGVGVKKLKGLLAILEHVAVDPMLTASEKRAAAVPTRSFFSANSARMRFSSRLYLPLREVDWDNWRHLVGERQIGGEPIGRYVSNLREIPRSSWPTPLDFYLACSLGRLFTLKLHGSRRVAAVAETFRRLAESPVGKKATDACRPASVIELLNHLEHLHHSAASSRRRGVGDWSAALRLQIEHDLGPLAGNIYVTLVGQKIGRLPARRKQGTGAATIANRSAASWKYAAPRS